MRDFREDIEGYGEIKQEMEICRKYGINYRAQKSRRADVVSRLHPRILKLRLADIILETPTTKTLRLVAREGNLPPFQAGQYINLQVEINGVRTSRPFSISSSPRQTAYYDITVRKIENGFVSAYLFDDVRVGDEFTSSGPAGNFYYNPLFHGEKLVFLAGGSGVTPFMSMIRENIDLGLDREIHLFYGSQTSEELIFHSEFSDIAARRPNFHYHPVLENVPADYEGLSGMISSDLINRVLGDIKVDTYYICGPQGMYDALLPQLKALNIPARKIRHEMFGNPADITAQPGWPREIRKEAAFTVNVEGRKSFAAQAGEPLLIALEKAGLIVPSLCRSGECSLCRVQLLSGKVFQPQGVLMRESDKKYGYIHSCKSYPLEDLEIRL
ncbi:MAG TPA: FAD-binding oxidoreductase [Syntrophomonas sp.]|nr:FAD-binding oxidoreductase [Syntrophomonas sp.]